MYKGVWSLHNHFGGSSALEELESVSYKQRSELAEFSDPLKQDFPVEVKGS